MKLFAALFMAMIGLAISMTIDGVILGGILYFILAHLFSIPVKYFACTVLMAFFSLLIKGVKE